MSSAESEQPGEGLKRLPARCPRWRRTVKGKDGGAERARGGAAGRGGRGRFVLPWMQRTPTLRLAGMQSTRRESLPSIESCRSPVLSPCLFNLILAAGIEKFR
jgi:hypothetical protein